MGEQHVDVEASDLVVWRVQFYELEGTAGWYASRLDGPTGWWPTKDQAVQAFRDLAQAESNLRGMNIATVEEFEAEKRPKYRPAASKDTPS